VQQVSGEERKHCEDPDCTRPAGHVGYHDNTPLEQCRALVPERLLVGNGEGYSRNTYVCILQSGHDGRRHETIGHVAGRNVRPGPPIPGEKEARFEWADEPGASVRCPAVVPTLLMASGDLEKHQCSRQVGHSGQHETVIANGSLPFAWEDTPALKALVDPFCRALLPARFVPEGMVNTYVCKLRPGHVEKHQAQVLSKVGGRFPDDGIVQWDDETDLDRVARQVDEGARPRPESPERSRRAVALWEALHNVGTNEQAWEILEAGLSDERREAYKRFMASPKVPIDLNVIAHEEGIRVQVTVNTESPGLEGHPIAIHHLDRRLNGFKGGAALAVDQMPEPMAGVPVKGQDYHIPLREGDPCPLCGQLYGSARAAYDSGLRVGYARAGLLPQALDAAPLGLTSTAEAKRDRRERIATAVLGHLATAREHWNYPSDGARSSPGGARVAVAWADALIAELDK
jgi:hypothetical protein